MKEIQRRKVHNIEKPFPGCLGRMVNLFDLNAGVTRNKLLMDKPHRDGSLLPGDQSDVPVVLDSSHDNHIKDELRHPIGKANGTPIKMLIDHEMSKDTESKIDPPNVVAKLMGLDTLPKLPGSTAIVTHSSGVHCTIKGFRLPQRCMEQDDGSLENKNQCQTHQCSNQKEYKDVYEIWQQSLKSNHDKKKLHHGSFDNNIDEKKMALVRQKFIEAKRLATDERLRQSKEFQDALEILSSNKELFVKLLQEPNSLFSQHGFQVRSLPSSPEKKCITILRPSKLVESEKFSDTGKWGENQMKRPGQVFHSVFHDKFDSSYAYAPTLPNQRVDEYLVEPTRIVVLKPNSSKSHGVKAVVTQACSSPIEACGNLDVESEDVEASELKEVTTEISKPLSEDLKGHRRDETLISSVLSNGYTGDESSFYKSENEYADGDFSDLDLMSPSSRHSWDYVNKFGSPHSMSSFGRLPCSPESSVCREAKKRLSERWSTMVSNANSQEQRHVRRSSSTLGEMLSLSNPKKSFRSDDPVVNEDEEKSEFASCLSRDSIKEDMGSSPRSLQRSKSAPVSPVMSSVRLSLKDSDSVTGKSDVAMEKASSTKIKSSIKGKISSLFFSRNKKASKEKCNASQCKEELHPSTGETLRPSLLPGMVSDDASSFYNSRLEECSSSALCGSSGTSPDFSSSSLKLGMVSLEAGLPFSFTRHLVPGNTNENLDHPSPCSVLEPPFDEYDNMARGSEYMKLNPRGIQVPIKSNLIDKSPPIESIARTLTWEDSYSKNTDPCLFQPSLACEDAEEEEQKWLFYVRTLLSAAGFDEGVQCSSFSSKWHSLENPLDPSLRNKYANLSNKEPVQEAKWRQLRSNWKLVYDSVNAALVEITGYWSDKSTMFTSGNTRLVDNNSTSEILVDSVWDRLMEWLSSETRCSLYEIGDSNSLVVERVVGKEVAGKGWAMKLQKQIDELGKDIEGKLLEELLEETLIDLTGCP